MTKALVLMMIKYYDCNVSKVSYIDVGVGSIFPVIIFLNILK